MLVGEIGWLPRHVHCNARPEITANAGQSNNLSGTIRFRRGVESRIAERRNSRGNGVEPRPVDLLNRLV